LKIIKVIHINTPYQIILNLGIEDGIKVGDSFLIYGLGPIIVDPDTGEEYERLEIVRGRGKVTHIQSKICTVDSILFEEKPKTIKRSKQDPFISAFGKGTTEETEILREKLEFNEVQIGDRARKL
jgi:hypothetical protein